MYAQYTVKIYIKKDADTGIRLKSTSKLKTQVFLNSLQKIHTVILRIVSTACPLL